MFISKKMQDAINEQINAEMYSAYLYLSMSAYFETQNLPGFASWLKVQFHEEQAHALKFYDYVMERGGEVELKAIAKPAAKWDSPMAAFKEVLKHEQHVTALIHKLYEVALEDKDYASQILLQWYISEQVEEEDNASQIVASLERIEAHDTAVLMLDHRLGKRGGEED
jgi:ferritin